MLDPLKAQHRRTFDHLMEYIQSLPGVEREIIWYGPAWKWTIHYTLPMTAAGLIATGAAHAPANGSAGALSAASASADGRLKTKGKADASAERQTLCYLVPRVESPMISVPLSDDTISHLPLARLSKLIRDGIKLAKCAVAIHWATWSPSTLAETGLIIDLIKRRHKMFMGAEKEKQAAQANAQAPATPAGKSPAPTAEKDAVALKSTAKATTTKTAAKPARPVAKKSPARKPAKAAAKAGKKRR